MVEKLFIFKIFGGAPQGSLWDPHSPSFGVIRIEIATCRGITHTHTYIHTYTENLQPRDRWRCIAPMPLGLFVEKLQRKFGLAGYDILFAYFEIEAKSKNPSVLSTVSYQILSFFFLQDQFLFCKRCLIGSGGTLIWRHFRYAPGGFPRAG